MRHVPCLKTERASTIITSTAFQRESREESSRRHLYWIALTDSMGAFHKRALQTTDDIVTTNEVLAEYLTFFCGAPEFICRQVALAMEDILRDSGVTVIPQSRESFLSGLRLYRERPDKRHSLIDCISMQTVRREGLSEVLINHRHFEQGGFRCLFRDP